MGRRPLPGRFVAGGRLFAESGPVASQNRHVQRTTCEPFPGTLPPMADEEEIEHRGGARIVTSALDLVGHAEPVGHTELELAIARLATGQHGRVSRVQLLALGVHRRSIARRIECGRLHARAPGVYGVGHCASSREGRLMEGVLEMGEGGVPSDLAAAGHWRLRPSRGGKLDVTVARRKSPNPRLRIHRRQLAPDEVTVHDGIPTTTVARTLFDCARHLDDRQLLRAFNEAAVLELYEELSVPDLMERHPGYRGTARLRRVIELLDSGEGVPQTDLEDLPIPFVEEFGLPTPEADVHIEIGGETRQRLRLAASTHRSGDGQPEVSPHASGVRA